MVDMHAPELSFTELNFLLRTATVCSTDAEATLLEHGEALFRALAQQQAKRETGNTETIAYRRAAPSTRTHPKPTPSELSCIEALEQHFAIPMQEAALLLRDFLHDAKGGGVSAFLDHRFTLADIAPMLVIEDYKVMENRNAFLTLVTICAGASQRSTHPYKYIFASFLSKNAERVKATVLKGAEVALHGVEDSAGNNLAVVGENWWFLELLFAYCLHNPLMPSDRDRLLQTYLSALKKGSGTLMQQASDSKGPTIDLGGAEATALFVASINLSNCLAVVVQEENEHMDTGVGHRVEGLSFSGEKDAMVRVNASMLSMRDYQSAEIGILSLSWASFLNLRESIFSGRGNWETENDVAKRVEVMFDPAGHMSFALERNVFSSLRDLAQLQLQVDELITGELYRCLWVDMIAFLTAFPPQNFTQAQVEDVVELTTALLSRTDHGTWVDTAESIWEREGTSSADKGANVLLRLASGVFPQSFRPLVSLLSALAPNRGSAERVRDFLENRLESLTEHSEVYQDALIVLDGEKDFPTGESGGLRNASGYEEHMRKLSCLCIDEDELVYIQAGEDIPSDVYRREIKRGTLGVSNTSMSVVTWITEWNGFQALNYILRFFLRLLREHEASSSYENDVLSELLLSTLDCFKLFDRLCRSGSKKLRSFLAKDEERLSVISNIVAELLDPGDWARGSWLTRKRREVLLTASTACVASMTMKSNSRARHALEQMSSFKNDLPLQATMSALGVSAFPSVAAISRVAELCSHNGTLSETFMIKASDPSSSNGGRVLSDLLQCFRGDANVVYQFLRGVALPLWLTTSVVVDADPDTKSLHWLLPACSLHLFSTRPSDILNDPAICSVIASVITAAAGSGSGCHRQTEVTDTFLFPALRAALVSCYEAFCHRNAFLQNRKAVDGKVDENNGQVNSPTNNTIELTALEKVFLKLDVIHALAMMSSGCAVGLTRRKFFSMWASSEFQGFLPDSETDRYLYWHSTEKDARSETVCSWKEWVQDMCARCLSLHFCCLSHMSESGDIVQVPWPTMERISPGYWRGGGQGIRAGFADRITRGRSVATVELLVTVLSCGQRAAARSLMGPNIRIASRSDVGDIQLEQTSGKPPSSSMVGPKGSEENATISAPGKAEESREFEHDILAAVASLLRESRDGCVETMSKAQVRAEMGNNTTLKELGQKSLLIAACVRFLKVGWESHSNLWFRKGWGDRKIWDLLSSLLRCDAGQGGTNGKVDLAKTLHSFNDFLSTERIRTLSEQLRVSSIPKVVLKQSLTVDTIAAWKSITADCLHIFAFEISMQISEALIASSPIPFQNDNSESSDRREMRVSAEVFQREPFARFASVFTERWMHVLLTIDDVYLRGCVASGVQTSQDAMQNDVQPFTHTDQHIESIEDRIRKLSLSLARAIGLNDEQAEYFPILNDFRRTGDVKTRFGTDYEFDVPAILAFLEALEIDIYSYRHLILEMLLLNTELNRKDVQVEVITAFSEMASAVLFADAFAPNQNAALTYSSPQFGGKLCRFLSRMLVCMMSSVAKSCHTSAISVETAKLMASLSASLTTDELQHPALTSIRFPSPPKCAQKECSMSPVAQICISITRTLACTQTSLDHPQVDSKRLDTVRWLLLTVARLATGTSFRNAGDFHELAKCATDCLRLSKPIPSLYSAASVAICSVPENQLDDKMTDFPISPRFDAGAIDTVCAAVSALARESGNKSWKTECGVAASSLLLAVSHIHLVTPGRSGAGQSKILRHLCGGNILAFLPDSETPISTYDERQDSRNSAHLLWCACLRVAGRVIPSGDCLWEGSADREQILRDVLEFCSTSLLRISRDSLDLSGDWPIAGFPCPTEEEYYQHGQQSGRKYPSLGRSEEAEAGCFAIFKLSSYGLQLQENLPELLHRTVTGLLQFAYQVYKVIRAEPVERSVRPVTQREKDRSQLWRVDRDDAGVHASYVPSPLPWTASPSKAGGHTASTPPRRSPSQALRAAIGGSGGNVRGSPGGIIPPSPGVLTPLFQSPLVSSATPHNGIHPSPGSPWGPYGSGIITAGDLYFGEEASRSLLRALGFALGSLRRFADVTDVMLFKPTMVISGNDVGLGLLVALQYHACGEIYRGAQEPRRSYLQNIIDNALHMTMSHVLAFNDRGLLTQGVKDEIRKRVATVRSRMQKVAPPAPAYSLIHAPELVEFLYQLKPNGN
ncbi:unnamed protein product [Chondrus crispus]|uniref:Uncharacterized protein n=1 Tax=Chondrus crispus TaxID=2769 RepID=R7QT20_CHOCR|nr:unnamed protein product [Chondrus crispus]CDF40873.1 unnamed protein product [Chondrus crispus]|eukprot:XP_005711167.1 unnamed protein product [Chondrus crispus]